MEQKPKKREWVKNAAIIFLAVMLVLTFFSNTILNRTLPEVVTRYVEPNSIDAKVRISGTVSARENYDVMISQTQKVASVAVRVGQEVHTGDLLFTLESGDSDELETARKELERLELEYQRALLNATSADYARENRDIALAQTALEEAKAKLDGVEFVSQEALDAAAEKVELAELALSNAKDSLASATKTADAYGQELDDAQFGFQQSSTGAGYIGGGSTAGLESQVAAATAALTEAANELRAAHLKYDADYNALKQDALNDILTAKGITLNAADQQTVIDAVDEQLKAVKTNPGLVLTSAVMTLSGAPAAENTVQAFLSMMPYYMRLKADEYAEIAKDPTDPLYPTASARSAAYTQITAAVSAFETADNNLENARSALADANNNVSFEGDVYYNGKSHSYYEKEVNRLTPLKRDADKAKATAETAVASAETALAEAKTEQEALKTEKTARETAYSAAQAEVASAQRTLEDLLFSLSEQKKSDGKQQALEALSRQELQSQIADAQKKVEDLSGASVTEVRAKVNGTIASISVSAGHKAEAEKALASIEVEDLGYTLTATITADQARLLHVGDSANVSNYYWGSQTTAVLSGMQPDPKDPRTSRVLTFDIAGDVSSGDKISFSIGEKNASYDLVVPNSAVRSDTNGSFVLMITAKNSPLGNRYFATRVDVEVVAADDYNTAVKGALSNMDSVITTSSGNAPVKNGDQVRLADMN